MIKQRESNIELLRILAMFLIVLHHYCVNSGLVQIMDLDHITANTVLVQFMSIGGKVGVNIFFLISGFYMVNSSMKWIKVCKLLGQIFILNIIVFLFLTSLGYDYGIKDYLRIIPIVFSVPDSFIASYLMVYLLSSLINKFVKTLNKKEFGYLLGILLFYYVILQSFFLQNTWHYFGWAFVLYLVGAYIKLFDMCSLKLPFGKLSILLVLIIWGCILAVDFVGVKYGFRGWTFFIGDSNKITVFLLGLSIFFYFLNLRVKYNKFINLVAGASFGVLLLHANNHIMRQWLWKDFLDNVFYFDNPFMWVHMFISVIAVYVVCTIIELLRKNYIEDPIFNKFD